MKLIDKDALLAEIERIKAEALQKKSQCKRSGLEKIMHQIGAYNKVLSFIDTLEVKEGDLNGELNALDNTLYDLDGVAIKGATHFLTVEDVKDIAKHFFELGLKASNPFTWEDINSILYIERLVLRDFGGQEHSNEELCREVLKRFKAQKGEKV